jgi:hypothetical protein
MADDEEITSDTLDALLDETETLEPSRPAGQVEVRLYIAVDPETLHELEQRAATDGKDLSVVAA